MTTGFAYTPTTTLAEKELDGLSCYPSDTAKQKDEHESSGSLSRQIHIDYSNIMFSTPHAAVLINHIKEMSDETAMVTTSEKNGLFNYLDVDTRSKIPFNPPLINSVDKELVNMLEESVIHHYIPVA